MLTLSDYQKLDKDLIAQGIYDWLFQSDSGFLQKCAVVTVKGNGIKYNVKTVRAGVSFQDPMDDVVETTPTFSQRSAALYVAIKDSLISKFAVATNGTQNPQALQMKSDVEDFTAAINNRLVLGQTSTTGSTKEPKGMLKILAELESEATTDLDALNNTQVIANSSTSGALTLDKLDELIDACDKPNFLMMSKRSRRKVNVLARASGSVLKVEQDGFGRFIQLYNDLPIYINTNIPDNLPDNAASVCDISAYVQSNARANTVDNSPIFCGRFGDEGAFCINQAEALNQEYVGISQKKDADIRRIKWYHGFAAYSKYSLAVLTGSCPTD
jgi:hypothetical protein